MLRTRCLLVCSLVVVLGGPAFADTVLTIANHTDAFSMMGQNTPAKDDTFRYWFGDDAIRYDSGETLFIISIPRKKMYFVNHAEKTYSTMDLPIDMKKLMGPEMAPMLDQMATMMAATVKVTPTDRAGSFAGFACTWSKIEISMSMMQMVQDSCLTETLPIDYTRYKELASSQADMVMGQKWMKELAEKVKGFALHTDTTTTMMGKQMKSWQELKSVADETPPAGNYDPPAGYKEVKYDPMAQAQRQSRH